jgi:hypothetical protein
MPTYKITLKQTLVRLAYATIEAENEEEARQESVQNWSNYEDDADPEIGDCEIVKVEKIDENGA